ncbi:hypothetical protein GWI33_013489 [Rhynchophorus ferrugineus]|uniref:Uncharacterized protein n=1 Tax=Rhynchophorus ferrugineus TaxID=354439 RepID=A0A834I9J3_RHYFE|nr:hypothetical protein GWI33_013489 [Rhynchophorus ferrugineus]
MGPSTILKRCFKYLLLLIVVAECRKWFGGGKSGRISSSRPSPSRPSTSYSRPSSHYPSPSHPNPVSLSYSPSHGSPSSASRPIGFDVNSRPSSSGGNTHPVGPPNYGFNTGGGSSSFGSKPSSNQEHVSVAKNVGTSNTAVGGGAQPPPYGFKPAGTSNTASGGVQPPSYGFKPSAPVDHATNAKPLGTSNTAGGGSQPPAYGFKPSAPVGPPTNVKPVGNTQPGVAYPVQPPPYSPYNPGVAPPAYNPAHNPAGYGPPPPAYSAGGYGQHPYGGYPQQQYHAGGYQPHYGAAPSGITNININNYNTHTNYGGGGFGGGYGGYSSYPTYHYSHSDVGSGTLGFFLGYSLAKLTTPTYHFGSSGSYSPRYDHYEVHHYYHNKESIPAQSTIQPNAIVGCIGDSGTICPSGTTSLCTNNGAILCVASATSTVPCTDQKEGNCVKTVVPCVNGTGDCSAGQNKSISIPCISKAKVMGNITYVNNTIIVNNTTIINNSIVVNNNMTVSNNNMTVSNNNMTVISSNSTVNNTSSTVSNTTTVPTIMTTLIPETTTMAALNRSKRDTPTLPVNDFCVTILALPAERKPTPQEKFLSAGTTFFSKFFVRAFGANNL